MPIKDQLAFNRDVITALRMLFAHSGNLWSTKEQAEFRELIAELGVFANSDATPEEASRPAHIGSDAD